MAPQRRDPNTGSSFAISADYHYPEFCQAAVAGGLLLARWLPRNDFEVAPDLAAQISVIVINLDFFSEATHIYKGGKVRRKR
jgi:hypothetical protein